MLPVACVGDSFSGYCSACEQTVQGIMVEGEFVSIEGKNICVTGSMGRGNCGHTCTAQGTSVVTIQGNSVVRVGDAVTGTITGTIISGSDFCRIFSPARLPAASGALCLPAPVP